MSNYEELIKALRKCLACVESGNTCETNCDREYGFDLEEIADAITSLISRAEQSEAKLKLAVEDISNFAEFPPDCVNLCVTQKCNACSRCDNRITNDMFVYRHSGKANETKGEYQC